MGAKLAWFMITRGAGGEEEGCSIQLLLSGPLGQELEMGPLEGVYTHTPIAVQAQ